MLDNSNQNQSCFSDKYHLIPLEPDVNYAKKLLKLLDYQCYSYICETFNTEFPYEIFAKMLSLKSSPITTDELISLADTVHVLAATAAADVSYKLIHELGGNIDE